MRERREPSGFWVWFAASVFYPLTFLLAKRVTKGAEHVPARGPVILVMNHISHLDPVYDAVFVHRQRRVPRFLAKNTLWDRRLVKQVMTGSGQIPVYRGSVEARDSLRHANEALAKGRVVVVYPEGTITRDPNGWPMTSRPGVGRLALDNLDKDVTVLPVTRWGTLTILDIYKKKVRLFPRALVTTYVGEPVDLSGYKGKPVNGVLTREVTELLMRKVLDQLGEIRGETPPAEFYRYRAKPKPATTPADTPAATPGETPTEPTAEATTEAAAEPTAEAAAERTATEDAEPEARN
ncbi:MAG TPA: lysophospholipid acyltransferase family protein [Pseudonocardiaceae bacterium]|nr:lysophospholipid acyltransferase family protein [Pseudonocardiaceae bacterium]